MQPNKLLLLFLFIFGSLYAAINKDDPGLKARECDTLEGVSTGLNNSTLKSGASSMKGAESKKPTQATLKEESLQGDKAGSDSKPSPSHSRDKFTVPKVTPEDLAAYGIQLHLREPRFKEGKLTTDQGGVILGPNMRVQARHFILTYQPKEKNVLLEAWGDLIFDYNDFVFIGEHLTFDFTKRSGTLYQGRTGVEPWYFGGQVVHLCPDGSVEIDKGFLTTSENNHCEWTVTGEKAYLVNQRYFRAKNIFLNFLETPFLWLPQFQVDLRNLFDSPLHYIAEMGGTQGPRLGLTYDFLTWNRFKAKAIFDYRLKRGPGGGIETIYKSKGNRIGFRTINYLANDNSRTNRKERTRYRFQGDYHQRFENNKTELCFSYDKLSDIDMATDYCDHDLRLEKPKKTQIQVRHQERDCIIRGLSRFRLNDFQTVKQEIPTVAVTTKPLALGSSGIIADNKVKASYVELEYTEANPHLTNYNSTRYEFVHSLYRPFVYGPFTATPQIGIVAIYYGNNPNKKERWMTMALFETELHTQFWRHYGTTKHVVIPYLHYFYYTDPTTSPRDHYIFDIDDGWFRLNMLRLGVRQSLYGETWGCMLYRPIEADLWTQAFFKTDKIAALVPKVYGQLSFMPTQRTRHTLEAAWDFDQQIIDHFNWRLEVTLSQHLAFAGEYRHRSAFDWRKVDHTNFMLDTFRSTESLKASRLSDRRDTFLFHFFWKLHPSWGLEWESRQGWNRRHEPHYSEYQIALLGTIQSTWHVKLAYRRREDDSRLTLGFSVGLVRPAWSDCYSCLAF